MMTCYRFKNGKYDCVGLFDKELKIVYCGRMGNDFGYFSNWYPSRKENFELLNDAEIQTMFNEIYSQPVSKKDQRYLLFENLVKCLKDNELYEVYKKYIDNAERLENYEHTDSLNDYGLAVIGGKIINIEK